MGKSYKLAIAELTKLFYRPSMFILTGILIVCLVVISLLFQPTSTISKNYYDDNSVGTVYSSFFADKDEFTNILTNAYLGVGSQENYGISQQYEEIIDNNGKGDKYNTLTDKITFLKQDMNAKIIENTTNTNLANIENNFKTIKINALDVKTYLENDIKDDILNFYLTTTQYDSLHSGITALYNTIPTDFSKYTFENFKELGNIITTNHNLTSATKILSELKVVTFDETMYNSLSDEVKNGSVLLKQTDYDALVKSYYTDAKFTLQFTYLKQIEDFNAANAASTKQEDLDKMNEYIAEYKCFAEMNAAVLQNSFTLLRINSQNDTALDTLVGFTQANKYALNEETVIYKYLIAENDFAYNYLTNLNFLQNSGAQTNAFDFTFFAMQILCIFITVFVIYYACSSMSGDQTSGTMKMIAIRPYSRFKLYSGKFMSTLMFAKILLFICLIASFVVGLVMFSAPASTALIAFNATQVVKLSPYILLALYFVSIILNSIFYISLALLICLIFKNNTLSVLITSVIYVTQLLLNAFVNSAWLKFTPFGHLDLYKYLGNSSFGFLKLNILPDSNLIISSVVILCSIFIMNILSHTIFKTKDIA